MTALTFWQIQGWTVLHLFLFSVLRVFLFDLCLLFGCVSVRYIAGRTEGFDTLFENRLADFDLEGNDIEKIDSEIESHEGRYRKNRWGGHCQDDLDGDKINIVKDVSRELHLTMEDRPHVT